jgi:hypothetical protein
MGMIDTGMGWAIFGVLFIFIFILLGILGESQRQKAKLAKQELLQKDRMMAMEKGLPLPEWDASMLDEDGTRISSAEAHVRKKEWFRLVTMAVGLVLVFAGAGMLVAFNFAPTPDWKDIASVGFIPFMAGLGLLLFHRLSRNGTG